jgi:hypothetical protein
MEPFIINNPTDLEKGLLTMNKFNQNIRSCAAEIWRLKAKTLEKLNFGDAQLEFLRRTKLGILL